jgi:hypothetical protein
MFAVSRDSAAPRVSSGYSGYPLVAVDKELGILYVLFRNTGQLFAFRIVGYEGE